MTIPATMQAVRAHAPQDYRLETLAVPTLSAEEVLIRVKAAGICGSDAKCYSGSSMFWGDNPWVKAPVIVGHEFFGEVVALGEGAAEKFAIALGETVIAEQIYPCEKCRYCRRGQYWMCQVHNIYGFQKEIADGAWAEYMKFGANSRIHRIPSDLPNQAGVLIEPLACAIHAVERANIQLGDVVVLAGAGTLGLLMLQIIRLKNPSAIIVHDTKDERLAVALELGADHVCNVRQQDPLPQIHALTEGYGADVFIEATGAPQAVVTGLELLRKLGTFVAFGVFREKTLADWSIIGDRKELNIFGAHLGPYCYPKAIEYLHKGIVKYAPIVTHVLPLAEFQSGMELVLASKGIKVVLEP